MNSCGETREDPGQKSVEEEYQRMLQIRKEIDAQLGDASLTQALYEVRECESHRLTGEIEKRFAVEK